MPAEPEDSPALKLKEQMQSFFSPGRLLVEPDGRFESWDSIQPGTYRLRGTIEDIRLDQRVEVLDPRWNGSLPEGLEFGALEPRVIELGDILIVPQDSASATQ